MIGFVFYGQSHQRLRYLIVAGIGLVLTVAGFAAVPQLAMLGLPLALGGAIAALRPAPIFQLELRPEGLHFQPGDLLLPYGTIVAVTGLRKANNSAGLKPFPIDVCGEHSGLRIPAHPDVPARELEAFLISRASPFINPPEDRDVAQFYDEECAKYGPDRVALHHGRTHLIKTVVTRHFRFFALGWVIGAVIAIGLALNLYAKDNSVSGVAILMMVVGIVLFLVSLLGDTTLGLKRQAGLAASSLVISPSGLALCQGKLKGKLRWDEVKNITLKRAAATASTGSLSNGTIGRQSLHLQVPGAAIILTEVYDRSLTLIKQTIEHHCHNRARV